ncbi:MAG: hypothetical protein KDJ47_13560 [Hyphomicrobiaceae bacterium]|nr:hypothetical protein [Hyphomicrobiaceae bacterium]
MNPAHRMCVAALAIAASAIFPFAGLASPGGNIEGTYCLQGVREVGSCFRLTPDGKFQYYLSYGAYDEQSEGTWQSDGDAIVLQTPAYDRKPTFTFKEQREAESGAYEIIVGSTSSESMQGINVRVLCDGTSSEGYTQYDGYKTDCQSPPETVALGIGMVGLDYQTVALPKPAGMGKAYLFVFDPGDMGRKPLVGTRLQRDELGTLHLTYTSTAIRDLDGMKFKYQRNGP